MTSLTTRKGIKKRLQSERYFENLYRYLSIVNATSDFKVVLLSEPFASITLEPGEKTKLKKPFYVGVYPLTFKWYKIGSIQKGTKTVNISIGRERSEPIKIY